MEPPYEEYVDYKEMYLKMARASEKAIRLLIEAQRECEELYLSAPEPLRPEGNGALDDSG